VCVYLAGAAAVASPFPAFAKLNSNLNKNEVAAKQQFL